MENWEIWLVDISDGRGHEQKGERPALLVSHCNNMCIMLPITSNLDAGKFSFAYLVEPDMQNQLDCESIILLFQIKSLDKRRLVKKIGALKEEHKKAVKALLREMLKV